MTDSPVAARRAVRGKTALLDPIDNGSRIHVEKSANFVSCVDALGFRLFDILHIVR